nr:hypothetical protein [Haloarcula sp. CBA1131]
MNDCQCHRGPDDDGVFRDGSVGLAHRRLSIIDPENGGQPIHNEDGTVTVIFNGEIYNYGALKERLTSAGHRFTTQTDTEVLVHLYEEEGPSFVDELDGMFAFALWTVSENVYYWPVTRWVSNLSFSPKRTTNSRSPPSSHRCSRATLTSAA